MAKFDMKSDTQLATGLSVTLSGTTAQTGNLIDTQGFEAITFLISTGTVTVAGVAGFSFDVQESDTTTGASFTSVAAEDLVGLKSALTVTADTQDNVPIGSIGYVGNKRYVRLTAVGTTNTNAVINCLAIKQKPIVGAASPVVQANIAAV